MVNCRCFSIRVQDNTTVRDDGGAARAHAGRSGWLWEDQGSFLLWVIV